ncbi:hypothetical protein EYF80_046387 [Liparis tanakae]|uniref:Uncharacterized protein n=1 Tax=Liparis tanakae TaxID=230148 RepID=A0A4Z2FQI6_9TELE|nr:hypothetical protein EYF80_046387 [Liparis tanakae]
MEKGSPGAGSQTPPQGSLGGLPECHFTEAVGHIEAPGIPDKHLTHIGTGLVKEQGEHQPCSPDRVPSSAPTSVHHAPGSMVPAARGRGFKSTSNEDIHQI